MDPNGPFPGSVVEQQQESRSLRDYVAILRRRAWMIVFVTIVTTASALAFSLTQQSLYQATASVLVNTPPQPYAYMVLWVFGSIVKPRMVGNA